MQKYHVNPETGKASACRARVRCAFKIPADGHYENEREARKAYEESMVTFQPPSVEEFQGVVKYRKPCTIIPEVNEKKYVDEVSVPFKELVEGDNLPDGRVIKEKIIKPNSRKVEFITDSGESFNVNGEITAYYVAEERTAMEGLAARELAIKEYEQEEAVLNNLPRPNKFWSLVDRNGVGRRVADHTEALDKLVEHYKSHGSSTPYLSAVSQFSTENLRAPQHTDLGPFVILEVFQRREKPATTAARQVMKTLLDRDASIAHNEQGSEYLEKLREKNPLVNKIFTN